MSVIPDEPSIQLKFLFNSPNEFRQRLAAIQWVLNERMWKGGVEMVADDGARLHTPTLEDEVRGLYVISLIKERPYNTPNLFICTEIQVRQGAQWLTYYGEVEEISFDVEIKFVGDQSTKRLYCDLLKTMANILPHASLTAAIAERCADSSEPTPPTTQDATARIGNPGLDRKELIYRLAKAQEAEELKREDSKLRWWEIAQKIDWKYGMKQNGVKILEQARGRLKRADAATLREISDYRKAKGN